MKKEYDIYIFCPKEKVKELQEALDRFLKSIKVSDIESKDTSKLFWWHRIKRQREVYNVIPQDRRDLADNFVSEYGNIYYEDNSSIENIIQKIVSAHYKVQAERKSKQEQLER